MNKIPKILTILFLSLILVSCTDVFEKKEAYCFSTVFDKVDNEYVLNVYCKTSSQKTDNENKLEEINFTFSADTPENALTLSENHDYEIYYKSCVALFFTDALSKDDIYNILVFVLNNTKYQSYAYIFNEQLPVETLKNEAQNIASDEKISYVSKENFIKLCEYIKKNNF